MMTVSFLLTQSLELAQRPQLLVLPLLSKSSSHLVVRQQIGFNQQLLITLIGRSNSSERLQSAKI